MKKSDKFSSLSETMFIDQLEEFCDNFNQDMHQKESAAMKKFIKALIPLGIGGVISVATANPLFVCLGVACFGGSAIIQIIKDAKEEDRKIAESDAQLLRDLQNAQAKKEGKKTEEKIVHLDQTNNLEAQVWGINPIIAHKDSDFYTEQLKELINETFNGAYGDVGSNGIYELENLVLTPNSTASNSTNWFDSLCSFFSGAFGG